MYIGTLRILHSYFELKAYAHTNDDARVFEANFFSCGSCFSRVDDIAVAKQLFHHDEADFPITF